MGELGKKVLLVDLDPQCNLTIISLEMETIHDIWEIEDDFIEDFKATREKTKPRDFGKIIGVPRSIHFHLKPTEDGVDDLQKLPPPVILRTNVGLVPGRLTLHLFEAKVAERWSGIYQGDPLAIRTGTRVRSLAHEFAAAHGYEIVIFRILTKP